MSERMELFEQFITGEQQEDWSTGPLEFSGHADRRICLLVEDNPLQRRLLELQLARFDYDVVSAANVDDALELLKGDPARVELVVTDLWLDGPKDGRDLINVLSEFGSAASVVLMTGLSWDDPRVLNSDVEGIPVLLKPFTRSELTAAVRTATGESQDGSQKSVGATTSKRRAS